MKGHNGSHQRPLLRESDSYDAICNSNGIDEIMTTHFAQSNDVSTPNHANNNELNEILTYLSTFLHFAVTRLKWKSK